MNQEVEVIEEAYRIVFPKLGIDVNINPTAFKLFGKFDIQWYGIIIAVGLLLAMIYCFPKMKKFGVNPDRGIDGVLGGIVGGLIGARAYYVFLRWEDYKGNLKSIFNTRQGGLAIYGGIMGAFLVGAFVCKKRNVKIPPMLDIAAMGFLIGQGIGRWGNFVNQEAFGTNTKGFLNLFGMSGGTIQRTINDGIAENGDMFMRGLSISPTHTVHPCFLYESIWCLLGFAFIAWFMKRRKFDGQLFLIYVAWYGFGRFFIEGLRSDSLMAGGFRASQVLAAVLVLMSMTLMTLILIKYRKSGGKSFTLYCNTADSKAIIAEYEEHSAKKNEVKAEEKAEAIIEGTED